ALGRGLGRAAPRRPARRPRLARPARCRPTSLLRLTRCRHPGWLVWPGRSCRLAGLPRPAPGLGVARLTRPAPRLRQAGLARPARRTRPAGVTRRGVDLRLQDGRAAQPGLVGLLAAAHAEQALGEDEVDDQ